MIVFFYETGGFDNERIIMRIAISHTFSAQHLVLGPRRYLLVPETRSLAWKKKSNNNNNSFIHAQKVLHSIG